MFVYVIVIVVLYIKSFLSFSPLPLKGFYYRGKDLKYQNQFFCQCNNKRQPVSAGCESGIFLSFL